jgi:TolB protein
MRYLNMLVLSIAIAVASCAQQTAWKGKIIHGYSGDINEYTFATKTDKMLFQKGSQPFVSGAGEVYYVNEAFLKAKCLIRKRTGTGQYRDVLDMSNENPDYKQALEDYSFIRGTGISAILSSMGDPKVSPDGKYLSVTIYGYKGQAFEKNCVAVFDIVTKKLVTKFEGKYYGNWLPDGRLLMSGWHKAESVDGSMYKDVPGIFVTDASLSKLQRINKDLDDPAPYHATPSPDGKRVAFVLDNHVWVMNIDGSGTRQLTDVDNDNIETFPAWSPDGKFISCWAYKTFERSYFTAIAIVPSTAAKPVVLSDKANVWPRDVKGSRISGGSHQMTWK